MRWSRSSAMICVWRSGGLAMVRVLALVAVMAVAQPALAIQVVQVTAPDIAPCAPGAAGCAVAAPLQATSTAGDRLGPKAVVAGLLGVLVLGLSFSRRKAGLPEVVS